MKILQKISVKLLYFIALLAVVNAVYGRWLWYDDVDKYADTLENLWPHQDRSQVIYFGESSNFHQAYPDTPKQRISDYLDGLLPYLQVGTVDNAGLSPSSFLHIMRHIPKQGPTQAVVVGMNLRALGPTWMYDQNSNYLHRANALIAQRPRLINRFLVALKWYGYLDSEQLALAMEQAWKQPLDCGGKCPYANTFDWNRGLANGGIVRDDGSWHMEKISMGCHYVKNYGFNIDVATNPVLADFDKMVALARVRGWSLYFHLLPVNMEEAGELVGPALCGIIRRNAQMLIDRYHMPEGHVYVVDNLELLPDSAFTDRDFPVEHYHNWAKWRCAARLAKAVMDNGMRN
ncbi:MAG: hypothetical protein HYZ16_04915 [Bacteroidetes bacterium]|jgi:hypothetical protein|nr:hypothetical protein [Bacteroidota bacterium]